MKRYLKIFFLFFLQTVKVELTYRSQVLQRLIGIAIMLSVTTFFWLTVSRTTQIGAYTPQTILIYFIIAAFHDFLFVSGDEFTKKIGESIRSGKLSTALVQPFPYLLKLFANGSGGIALRLTFLIPIALLVRFTVLKDFVFENLALQLGFYILAFCMAVLVSLICLIAAALLAFDMTEVWAVWVIFVSNYCLFSGVFFPPDLSTGLIASLMHWLPFYYMLGFPALILSGRLGLEDIAFGFAHGAFVLLYMSLLLSFMWRRGVKKFEAVGI
jgi:ABC-2 type transport system permease protein